MRSFVSSTRRSSDKAKRIECQRRLCTAMHVPYGVAGRPGAIRFQRRGKPLGGKKKSVLFHLVGRSTCVAVAIFSPGTIYLRDRVPTESATTARSFLLYPEYEKKFPSSSTVSEQFRRGKASRERTAYDDDVRASVVITIRVEFDGLHTAVPRWFL